MSHVINRLLDLMEKTTPQKRDNLRYIYLAQFGADIIPYCAKRYSCASKAAVRADLVRFVIQYSRTHEEANVFATSALSDRSHTVRRFACAVLAYSLKASAIPTLEKLVATADAKTADYARRAIDCITSRNHNRFYPQYNSWVVLPDDPDQPKSDSVNLFIVRPFPDLVPQLEEVYGNIYLPWREIHNT